MVTELCSVCEKAASRVAMIKVSRYDEKGEEVYGEFIWWFLSLVLCPKRNVLPTEEMITKCKFTTNKQQFRLFSPKCNFMGRL